MEESERAACISRSDISRSDTAMTRIRTRLEAICNNRETEREREREREEGERPNAVQRHRSKLPCGNAMAMPQLVSPSAHTAHRVCTSRKPSFAGMRAHICNLKHSRFRSSFMFQNRKTCEESRTTFDNLDLLHGPHASNAPLPSRESCFDYEG